MSKHKPGGIHVVEAASRHRHKVREARAAKRKQRNLTHEELLEQARNHPNTQALLRKKAQEAAEQADIDDAVDKATAAGLIKPYDPIEDAEVIDLEPIET